MSPAARTARTIADVGEFGFLARLLPSIPVSRGTVVGPGQDCAVIRVGARRLLLTVDALVACVHFERAWMSAYQIGRKSFLVNASDIAAMGGRPRWCVVSLGLPRDYPASELAALQKGILAAATDSGAAVVGGNLARAEQLFVSIALLGDAPPRLVTRQGARPGDRVYVTGTLGDAAAGVHLLRAGTGSRKGARLIRRFREPVPRLHAGRLLARTGVVSAMIDVSDGLLQDLGHICEQSRVGAEIDVSRVPLSAAYRVTVNDASFALRGGEDYELVCTVPERKVKRVERMQARLGCPLTWIGRVTRGRGVRVIGRSGPARGGGYDHFRQN